MLGRVWQLFVCPMLSTSISRKTDETHAPAKKKFKISPIRFAGRGAISTRCLVGRNQTLTLPASCAAHVSTQWTSSTGRAHALWSRCLRTSGACTTYLSEYKVKQDLSKTWHARPASAEHRWPRRHTKHALERSRLAQIDTPTCSSTTCTE